jgi:mannitol-1-/sugar-/sorbitol-6-phosphatase
MSESALPYTKKFAAILFDMDGTLLNSLAATERVWGGWARENGLDVEAFLPSMHGMRGVDTIEKLGLPGLDPLVEAQKILDGEIADVDGIEPIAGVINFLATLPENAWAIVTSAPRKLAERRLAAAGIPFPKFIVTSEDVENGKPHPACFLLGAERLGVSASDCIVFEDALAGIKAGEAAGAALMVVTATHNYSYDTHHPSIDSYHALSALIDENGWITLRNQA